MANPELGHGETIRGLVRGILTDIRTLIHEEIALARVEIRDQAGRARAAAISFGMAAAALIFAGTFLLIAIATAIADLLEWPIWAGFLAVAVLLSAVGLVTLSSGRTQLKTCSRGAAGNDVHAQGEFGMDREAAVIKSEMSQTRADLDRKTLAARSAREGNDAAGATSCVTCPITRGSARSAARCWWSVAGWPGGATGPHRRRSDRSAFDLSFDSFA